MSGLRWFIALLLGVTLVGESALQAHAESMVGLRQFSQPTDTAEEGLTLTLEPTSGLPGAQITATGSGYWECLPAEIGGLYGGGTDTGAIKPHGGSAPAPADQVTLFWDNAALSPRADLTEDATFTTSFTVPASATPGRHIVASRCADSVEARVLAVATFTVPAPPTTVLVLVPNLVGRPREHAPAALQGAGLVLGEVSGSGEVIGSQEPLAGKRVPSGTRVDITLVRTLVRQQSVAVPDLVGRTVNEARIMLATVGLVLGNNPDGTSRIRGQIPPAGALVARGSRIIVTVSDIPAPPVGEPAAGNPLPTTKAPTGTGSPTTDLATPTAQPTSPAAVSPTTGKTTLPWALLVVLVLILLGAGGSMLVRQIRRGPAWVRSHVQVVAGVAPHIGIKVAESPEDHSSRTCVVRITSHHGSDTRVLEVENR